MPAPGLPEPFLSTLENVSESGRIQFLSGMIKHASVCEDKHGSALIRLGTSGARLTAKMPCYWIMYLSATGNRESFAAYYYKDVAFAKEGVSPIEGGRWTDEHITFGQLLSHILCKNA
jgi:hypothetical protein